MSGPDHGRGGHRGGHGHGHGTLTPEQVAQVVQAGDCSFSLLMDFALQSFISEHPGVVQRNTTLRVTSDREIVGAVQTTYDAEGNEVQAEIPVDQIPQETLVAYARQNAARFPAHQDDDGLTSTTFVATTHPYPERAAAATARYLFSRGRRASAGSRIDDGRRVLLVTAPVPRPIVPEDAERVADMTRRMHDRLTGQAAQADQHHRSRSRPARDSDGND